jgi:hypothetical protein
MRSRSLALALASIPLTTGCLHFKQVGLVDKDIQVAQRVPLVCLDTNIKNGGGREATLSEGTLDGRPAIAVDGVLNIGFAYSFTDELKLDGQTVYVGQECLPRYDGVVCDRGLYVRRGDRRFFLHWISVDMTSDDNAQKAITDVTPKELANRPDASGFLAKLRGVDIDEPTGKALVELSRARNVRKKWNVVKFFSGAAAMQLGPVLKSKGLTDQGKEAAESAANPDVDESELALIAANPELVELFTLGAFGTVCVGALQYPR